MYIYNNFKRTLIQKVYLQFCYVKLCKRLHPPNYNITISPLQIRNTSRDVQRWTVHFRMSDVFKRFLGHLEPLNQLPMCLFISFATQGIWWNGFQLVSVMLNTRWGLICKLRRPLPKFHFLAIAHNKYEIKGSNRCLHLGFQGLLF